MGWLSAITNVCFHRSRSFKRLARVHLASKRNTRKRSRPRAC
jgi:hypothetical protein